MVGTVAHGMLWLDSLPVDFSGAFFLEPNIEVVGHGSGERSQVIRDRDWDDRPIALSQRNGAVVFN